MNKSTVRLALLFCTVLRAAAIQSQTRHTEGKVAEPATSQNTQLLSWQQSGLDTFRSRSAMSAPSPMTPPARRLEEFAGGERDSSLPKGLVLPAQFGMIKPAPNVQFIPKAQRRENGKNGLGSNWITIMSEDFESFPSTGWQAFAESGAPNAYWDDTNYRSYLGSRSAWCADAGSAAGSRGGPYRPNMSSWMVYGPFDLSDALDAKAHFYYWNESETGRDVFYWQAALDNGALFGGYFITGSTAGWVEVEFDLTDVPILGDLRGESRVWIQFLFTSDSSIEYEGAYVDEILLEKNVALPDLRWTSMTAPLQWDVGASVTINLTEENGGVVTAGSHQTQLYLSTNDFISSSDTPLGSAISFTSIPAGATQSRSRTFTVPQVPSGTYWVGALVDVDNSVVEDNENNNGGAASNTIRIATTSVTQRHETLPTEYALNQNFPNPFNPSTTIHYALPSRSKVQLVIYDLAGRVMKELVSEQQAPGEHAALWDGRDHAGNSVTSGVYIYRLTATPFSGAPVTLTRKLTFMK